MPEHIKPVSAMKPAFFISGNSTDTLLKLKADRSTRFAVTAYLLAVCTSVNNP